ncbi:MAG: VanZ family protein [Aeriscardovia sp.]|nr:VanZ family protein [Aeriscardovia sp.]MBO6255544.1 VanZ family protein [Bacteroidaceae bacterium]
MMFTCGLISQEELRINAVRYWNSLFTDIPDYVFQMLLSLFCLGTVVFLIWKGVRKGGILTARLLLIELMIVIYCSTVIFRKAGDVRGYDLHPFWSYGAIEDGRVELLAENIMNVVVFVPIGILLGVGCLKWPWWKAIGTGCLLSVSIEAMQLVLKRGFCEVDDVMHNTVGCMIGYVLVKGARCMVHGITKIMRYGMG